jgi:hypothetical protein
VLSKAFGVTLDLADRDPWEAVNKYLGRTSFSELYGGVAYIAPGEKSARFDSIFQVGVRKK